MSPHFPRFRLTLDQPYDFAREPGFRRTIHCHDFREDSLSLKENVWRCPVTGLVFLRPSWLNEAYGANFEPTEQWTRNNAQWEDAKRVLDKYTSAGGSGLLSAPMLASVTDNIGMDGLISWGNQGGAVWLSLVSLMNGDELEGALESKFTLEEDEGFVIHANALTDSVRRHRNWIALQWDNLQVHIRPTGQIAVYRWEDRAQIEDIAEATLVDEFFLSSPGEMADKDSYYLFLPIPTIGLLIYSDNTPQRMNAKVSSARSGSAKGYLVEIPSEERPDSAGNYRLTRSSKLTIALTRTPRAAHVLGFHRLRFPSVGTYLDAVFSLPYASLSEPSDTEAIALPTGRGTLTGTLVKPDNSALFAAGDSQARIKAIFANAGGGVYTPFLFGTDTVFPVVMTTRDTVPLQMTNSGSVWNVGAEGEATTQDLLQRLEFSESDDGRVEGKATVYAKSVYLKRILERGDCTWKIERQDDAEATWDTITGGLARWETSDVEAVFYDSGDDNSLGFGRGTRRRMAYRATLSLADMWQRFTEVHQSFQGALDGLTIGQAINRILLCSGFAELGGSVPAEMDSITLPKVPKGENWRHGSAEGDDGGAMLRQLLLYPRKQLSQFRLLYDWDAATWSCEKVSKLTGGDSVFWWFTPDQREAWGLDNPDGAPEAEFRIEYGSEEPAFKFKPFPPEANLIRPFGIEKPGTDGKRISGKPVENKLSIEDATPEKNRDYLGRCVIGNPMLAPLADEGLVNKFGRIVYEAIAHRRMVVTIPASGYEPLLLPGTRCDVRGFDNDGNLVTLFSSRWLRRKTCVIDYLDTGDIPRSLYVLDEQWDLPLD